MQTEITGHGIAVLVDVSQEPLRKRIAELEAALKPYALDTGYGLDGRQPNHAWRVLNGQR